MNESLEEPELRYSYQLETFRFVLLFLLFGVGGGALLWIGLQPPLLLNLKLLYALLGLVSLICFALVGISFFTKKEIILKADYFSCPHQSPLRMFSTVTIPYRNLLNLQKIDQSGRTYLMVVHQNGQLFIGQGMMPDMTAFEELHYFLMYKLGQELPSRTTH